MPANDVVPRALVALPLLLVAVTAGAPAAAVEPERVRVSASARYNAGSLHRFTFGGGYRDLWQAAIELPVLDLAETGGGLTPRGRFGGLQTAVLAFQGADGRAYTFRGTDKDPSAVLDPMLRETVLRSLVQDQMAAQHPGGPIAAGVLSEAAGVLTIRERMVVMPDDPSLGEYREEFAGMVGTFYEYPLPASGSHPGFHGASAIIDHEALYERLAAGHADKVDALAFLRARLLDLLLGDFDRHRKQWRWARLPGDPRWKPIPEDRDQAFVRYDGAGQRLGSIYVPILQCYGADYPAIGGLTLHGWEQDRWLLTGLAWVDWEPVVADLQRRISDDAIARAVEALPAEYVALDGQRMRADVTGRRDALAEAARAFYEHLAGEVDVHATDAAESVRVEWTLDDQLLVEVRPRAADGHRAAPHFSRRFDPDETDEVRIYLRGGDDVVRVSGEPGAIVLRLIASAEGQKFLDDSHAGETRLYDQDRSVVVKPGRGTTIIREPYERPPSDSGFVDVEDVPPRDWGSSLIPFPVLGYESDVDLLIGAGVIYKRFGFRKHPWSARHKLSASVSTGALQPLVEYLGQFRPENSDHLALLDVRFTGIEVLRFYGFGNETDNDEDDAFYRVRNQQFTLAPGFAWNLLDERLRIAAKAWLGYSSTADGDRLIDTVTPYGAGGFGHLGADLRLVLDTRRSLWDGATMALPFNDNPAAGYPTSGLVFDAAVQLSPPLWDADALWGSLQGSLAVYVATGSGRVAASLRAGGKYTFGDTPYFGAAYVGGGSTFSGATTARGFRPQRFAGDASLFGNLDARLYLARLTLIVPGDFGLHAFVDAARVFVSGEDSDDWHPSGGGGLWFAPLTRTNTVTLSVAASDEDILVYLRAGFHY